MFEAIHGSAPDIAGQDIANPSGLLLGAVQMLMHIDHPQTASTVYNAWLRTIEDGIHTADIFKDGRSSRKVGTKDFTAAVIDRLGDKPRILSAAKFESAPTRAKARELEVKRWVAPPQTKLLTGVDIFVDCAGIKPDDLAAKLQAAAVKVPTLKLALITNRGVKAWPNGFPETFLVDHWRCRFRSAEGAFGVVKYSDVLALMKALHEDAGVDIIKSENLANFQNLDGSLTPGFSLGQGE